MKHLHHANSSPIRRRTFSKNSDDGESSTVFHSSNNRPRKALLNYPSDDSRSRHDRFSSRGIKSTKTYFSGRTHGSLRNPSGAISRPNALGSGRVDPMLAAATAAAMVNLGLVSPNATDLSGLNTGGNSSTASAVAALALNAAAMAAALGVGGTSGNKALLQSGSTNRSLMSTSSASNFLRSANYQSDRDRSPRDRWVQNSERTSRTHSFQNKYDRDSVNTTRFPYHLDHKKPEDDPTATRTLFVGNLMPEITAEDLRSIFERYGLIEDIDVKRRDFDSGTKAYAFIRFVNLDMAHRAKVDMSGQLIGQFTCKVGYGKVSPTRCLWIGGLGPWITYPTFATLLNEFGPTEKIIWPSGKTYANVLFPNVEQAVVAADALRGYALGGPNRRIRVDFTDESHMIRDPLKRRRQMTSDSSRYDDHIQRDSSNAREYYNRSNTGERRYNKRDYSNTRDRSGSDRHSQPENEQRRKNFRSRNETPERQFSSPSRKRSRSPQSETENNNSLKSRSPSDPQSAKTIDDLAACLPMVWTGAFFLKSSSFPCQMYILRGDQTLVDQFMPSISTRSINPDSPSPSIDTDNVDCLRITQRMKLDPLKLDDVSQRISAAGNAGFCVLLALPTPVSSQHDSHVQMSESGKQPQRPLRNLISYLRTKESAGVVILASPQAPDASTTGVLHAFPPCDFAFSLLKESAIKLSKEINKDDHLVILLIRSTSAT